MPNHSTRPVFLSLARLHYPVTAVASFAHRVSGVLMVLALPVLIYLLSASLASEQSFREVAALMASLPAKLVATVLVWALAHHMLAGFRYLLIDLDIGVDLRPARTGAWLVTLGAPAVALIFLWGVA
jgi:succinate dehydrogenase / fumarate reductase, cytochrome b subunit